MHHSCPFILESVIVVFALGLLEFLDILIVIRGVHSSTMGCCGLSRSHALARHCNVLLLLPTTIRTLRIEGNSVSTDHIGFTFRCPISCIGVQIVSWWLSPNDTAHDSALIHRILIYSSATSRYLNILVFFLRIHGHAAHSLASSTARVNLILPLVVLLLENFSCHYSLAMASGCCGTSS